MKAHAGKGIYDETLITVMGKKYTFLTCQKGSQEHFRKTCLNVDRAKGAAVGG